MHYRIIANGLTHPCLPMVNFKRILTHFQAIFNQFRPLFSCYCYCFTYARIDASGYRYLPAKKGFFVRFQRIFIHILHNLNSNRICTITQNIRNLHRLCSDLTFFCYYLAKLRSIFCPGTIRDI